MNLKEYYQNLDKKYEFASRIATKCGVTLNTVLNWCKGYMKPGSEEKMNVLSETTGIPVNELFK